MKNNCELCRQGDPSLAVRCHNCQYPFHLHERQLAIVESGTIILADCPSCGKVNCFLKQSRRRVSSEPVYFYPGQTILDLRGK